MKIEQDRVLCYHLLALVALADEACDGAGLRRKDHEDSFIRNTARRLRRTSDSGAATLCEEIHASRLQVLPKLHTPQSGLTMRSLSHHLALVRGGAVEARWVNVPPYRPGASPRGLNLLVVPWPDRVVPSDFKVAAQGRPRGPHGLFEYAPGPAGNGFAEWIVALMKVAEAEVGEIDAIILPELALSESEYEQMRNRIHHENVILVTGVRSDTGSGLDGSRGSNNCRLAFGVSPRLGIEVRQDKHHRWRLDRQQIRQYGLGTRLDPTKIWWEDTPISRRALWFVGLNEWLTATVLICEDLARQEPVAEVVRAVGPNLVIALLMDGPQLGTRWPARYATVLADDPGSSVLTVTSLGMAQMSRSERGEQGSRVIALWKDDKDGVNVPIELPAGAQGVVLSVACETKEEWTADGRPGRGRAYYPTLVGINAVSSTATSTSVGYTSLTEKEDGSVSTSRGDLAQR